MSTYWYFECVDHTPPIRSDDEFTQHTDDARFFEGIELLKSRPLAEKEFTYHDSTRDYFDNNSRRFLIKHPTCAIEIVNEYNVRHDMHATKDTGTA